MMRPIQHSIFFILTLILINGFWGQMSWAASDGSDSSRVEQILVTADRIETPSDQISSSTTVITSEEIQNQHKDTVIELLRTVPGLSVSHQGGAAGLSTVGIRGMGNGYTLVLVDGVKVNDGLDPSGAFDFSSLSPFQIERIEIVRGAQSVLYGSEAMGGVINIITKAGTGAPRFGFEGEYGAYRTRRVQASALGIVNGIHYSLGAEAKAAQGFSAASEVLGNSEKDGYATNSAFGVFSGQPIEKLEVSLTARYTNSKSDLDASGGPPSSSGGDDPNYTSQGQRFSSRVEVRSKHSTFFEPTFGLSYSSDHRKDDNEPDSLHTDYLHDNLNSYRAKADFQGNFYLSSANTLVVGLEGEKEQGVYSTDATFGGFPSQDSIEDRSTSVLSGLLEDQYRSDSWFGSAGVRYDRNSLYPSRFTYRVAPGFRIPVTGTTFKGSVASGFKAPTLFQLYSSGYGSAALSPETSVSWDLGVEQGLLDGKLLMSATYFKASIKSLIDSNPTDYHYFNVGSANSDGVELVAATKFKDAASARVAYTFTEASSDQISSWSLKKPKHQLAAAGDYALSDSLHLAAALKYVGVRSAYDAVTFAVKQMPRYMTLDLSASYLILPNLKLFGRVENLLNEVYEETDGYGTAGRSVYVGLRTEI